MAASAAAQCQPPNRATAPVPASGATIAGGAVTLEWARPSKGSDPLLYDVYLDGVKLPECSNLAVRRCVTTVAEGSATRFWRVIAKNSCGDTTTYPEIPSEWRFKACSFPSAPDALAFSWQPNAPVVVGGVTQQQPYVGQEVTFSYYPAVSATSWSWMEYQKSPAVEYTTANPKVVYSSPGSKKMYLRAANCAGTRAITQYVTVHADIRPVEARFTASPPNPLPVELVTFSFDTSFAAGNPNEFTIDFGEGTPPLTTTESFVQHAYRCGRTYRAVVTARRVKSGSSVVSSPATQEILVGGTPCSALGLLVVDVPDRVVRADGAVEAGGVAIFNPNSDPMRLAVALRDKASGVLQPAVELPQLPPNGSLTLDDVLTYIGTEAPYSTLWISNAADGATDLPVVNAWSYLERPSGTRYGQYVPVSEIWPGADHDTTWWISGLIHDSVAAERGRYGSITRLTFVDPSAADPARTPWGTRKLILTLYDAASGAVLKKDSLNLDVAGGYRNDYLNRLFHLWDGLDLNSVMVRIDIPAGIAAVVTATVIDNATGSSRVLAAQQAR